MASWALVLSLVALMVRAGSGQSSCESKCAFELDVVGGPSADVCVALSGAFEAHVRCLEAACTASEVDQKKREFCSGAHPLGCRSSLCDGLPIVEYRDAADDPCQALCGDATGDWLRGLSTSKANTCLSVDRILRSIIGCRSACGGQQSVSELCSAADLSMCPSAECSTSQLPPPGSGGCDECSPVISLDVVRQEGAGAEDGRIITQAAQLPASACPMLQATLDEMVNCFKACGEDPDPACAEVLASGVRDVCPEITCNGKRNPGTGGGGAGDDDDDAGDDDAGDDDANDTDDDDDDDDINGQDGSTIVGAPGDRGVRDEDSNGGPSLTTGIVAGAGSGVVVLLGIVGTIEWRRRRSTKLDEGRIVV